jgi:hypothetical protein
VRRIYLLIGAAVLLAACGGGDTSKKPATINRDTLNERQRDTILARSRIPGASGVGKAMRVADSTSAQVQSTDTIH